MGFLWSVVQDLEHVIDLVDHAIVTDSEPPQVACPAELLAPRRSRIVRQRLDARKDPLNGRVRERFEILPGGADELDRILRHSA